MNMIQKELSIAVNPEYTYVYKQPFRYNWMFAVMSIPLLVLAYILFMRGRRLLEMKNKCTIEVTAVITALRKSNSIDGVFGMRGPSYNADYRYEFNGNVFESRNSIYGRKGDQTPNIGDTVKIRINPNDPAVLFDALAAGAMFFYFLAASGMIAGALLLLVGQVIFQIL